MKPILFNAELVRAILAGRKMVTRRVVKEPWYIDDAEVSRVSGLVMHRGINGTHGMPYPDQLYRPGDILYVRETWAFIPCIDCQAGENCNMTPVAYEDRYMVGEGCFVYRADYPATDRICWHPSIHMPREAARLFLRVKDVRVERLRDIDYDGCKAEGIWDDYKTYSEQYHDVLARRAYPVVFSELWDSTIKPAEFARYGWEADPWVWVIEFERITREEAEA